ncbi:unnamed protein product, partial [Sphacelaria rigidula]
VYTNVEASTPPPHGAVKSSAGPTASPTCSTVPSFLNTEHNTPYFPVLLFCSLSFPLSLALCSVFASSTGSLYGVTLQRHFTASLYPITPQHQSTASSHQNSSIAALYHSW